MIEIRYVQAADREFWFRLDKHLPSGEWNKKIRDQLGYTMLEDKLPIGLLRYHLFWDEIPFCTMLYIDQRHQRRGNGKRLMDYWESDMKRLGYDMVMTSTRTDEDAQHFYRKIGYRECGALLMNSQGHEQPMEIFFVKDIPVII